MLPYSLIKRVRQTAFDNVLPYRFSDERILEYINDGVKQIRDMRPDSRFDDDGETVDYEDAIIYPVWATATSYSADDYIRSSTGYIFKCTTDGISGATEPTWNFSIGATTSDGTAVWTAQRTDEIILTDRWLNALVHWCCYKLFEEEFDDTSDGTRSGSHFQLFRQEVYTL
jgi:hypothetical protein